MKPSPSRSPALNDTNRQREIDGLLEAMHAFKLETGMILTFEQTEDLKIEGGKN